MKIDPTCVNCADSRPKVRVEDSPYWNCENCGLWFQNPMPEKKFEAEEEKGEDGRSKGHRQPKSDLEHADHLAKAYVHNWIKKVPLSEGRSSYKVLDIGAKYPFFVSRIRDHLGSCEAYGLDAMDQDDPSKEPIAVQFGNELNVPMLMVDFEKVTSQEIINKTSDSHLFDSLSMIHVFEHMYDPVGGIIKLHELIKKDGVVLIRVPDNKVDGWKWHMSPRHYGIHPYFWTEKAFRLLIERSNRFSIAETYPMFCGTRDYLLKPIK